MHHPPARRRFQRLQRHRRCKCILEPRCQAADQQSPCRQNLRGAEHHDAFRHTVAPEHGRPLHDLFKRFLLSDGNRQAEYRPAEVRIACRACKPVGHNHKQLCLRIRAGQRCKGGTGLHDPERHLVARAALLLGGRLPRAERLVHVPRHPQRCNRQRAYLCLCPHGCIEVLRREYAGRSLCASRHRRGKRYPNYSERRRQQLRCVGLRTNDSAHQGRRIPRHLYDVGRRGGARHGRLHPKNHDCQDEEPVAD